MCIRPEELLYDAEHDLLAIATSLLLYSDRDVMCERNLAKVSHSRANASLNTYSYATTTPTFNIFQHQICDNAEK